MSVTLDDKRKSTIFTDMENFTPTKEDLSIVPVRTKNAISIFDWLGSGSPLANNITYRAPLALLDSISETNLPTKLYTDILHLVFALASENQSQTLTIAKKDFSTFCTHADDTSKKCPRKITAAALKLVETTFVFNSHQFDKKVDEFACQPFLNVETTRLDITITLAPEIYNILLTSKTYDRFSLTSLKRCKRLYAANFLSLTSLWKQEARRQAKYKLSNSSDMYECEGITFARVVTRNTEPRTKPSFIKSRLIDAIEEDLSVCPTVSEISFDSDSLLKQKPMRVIARFVPAKTQSDDLIVDNKIAALFDYKDYADSNLNCVEVAKLLHRYEYDLNKTTATIVYQAWGIALGKLGRTGTLEDFEALLIRAQQDGGLLKDVKTADVRAITKPTMIEEPAEAPKAEPVEPVKQRTRKPYEIEPPTKAQKKNYCYDAEYTDFGSLMTGNFELSFP